MKVSSIYHAVKMNGKTKSLFLFFSIFIVEDLERPVLFHSNAAGDFSCEVENNGRVSIKGITTVGERVVYRHSHAFEMQSQNLCPPGHFNISFNLPGPVDPHQFSGNFGTDGILEGMIMKLE